jgi:hypothetical protein
MDNWKLTHVYSVNNRLVVAKSVEEACQLYREFVNDNTVLITDVRILSTSDGIHELFEAIIARS